jgi:hypothetical protein
VYSLLGSSIRKLPWSPKHQLNNSSRKILTILSGTTKIQLGPTSLQTLQTTHFSPNMAQLFIFWSKYAKSIVLSMIVSKLLADRLTALCSLNIFLPKQVRQIC